MPTTFTATKTGPISNGDTFGNTSPGVKGTDWPAETDYLATGGRALTQGTATQVARMTGSGTLTLTGSFTCPDVRDVEIIVPNGVTSTINFGTSGVDPGCQYSRSNCAIECKFGGTVTDVTGDLAVIGNGYGVYNYGTWIDFSGNVICTAPLKAAWGIYNGVGCVWTDFSGTVTHNGDNNGVYNDGTWSDFSGQITGSGNGTGAFNMGTWSDFSGKLVTSSFWGVYNLSTGIWTDFSGELIYSGDEGMEIDNLQNGTWTDFSGTLTNSGAGIGIINNATWLQFSGKLFNTGSGKGVQNEDTWTAFSGEAVNTGAGTLWYPNTAARKPATLTGVLAAKLPANLAAGYIISGKTILGVAGSEIGAAAQLVTDQASVLASADKIATGTTILGQAGSYPTTATSKAEQLATDQAAVLSEIDNIRDGITILGQEGTLNVPVIQYDSGIKMNVRTIRSCRRPI